MHGGLREALGRRNAAGASCAARGRHPGGRPGGGSPSPARRRRRSCSSPWRGRRSPEAAPGAQLRPRAPRHASRQAPGEGAAWPRTARRRRCGSGGDGHSGGGAARGGRRPHPTAAAAAAARLLLRSCCCSCSPVERGGRRRRRLPLSPASRLPRPVPLPLPLPGRRLLSAARVSHQTPRPQCSAAPAAGRRRPKRGRALRPKSEPAQCRTYLAVAPRHSAASEQEVARG